MGVYAPHVEMPVKCASCQTPCKLLDYFADRPKECPLRNVVKMSANLILNENDLRYPVELEKKVEMELRAKLAERLPELWEFARTEDNWAPLGGVRVSATIYLVDNQGGLTMYEVLIKRLQDFAAGTERDQDAQLAFDAAAAIEGLNHIRQLNMAEIVSLRRQVEAREGGNRPPAPTGGGDGK